MGFTILSIFYSFFGLFKATPTTCRGSQARGQIGAVAADLHHSHNNVHLSCICDLHHSSQQCWILNPLSEGKDRTHVLMDTSQVH